MGKPSNRSTEEMLRVVLSVSRVEVSATAAGRRAAVFEQTVHNWTRLIPDAGREGPAQGRQRRTSPRATVGEPHDREGVRDLAGTGHRGVGRGAMGA